MSTAQLRYQAKKLFNREVIRSNPSFCLSLIKEIERSITRYQCGFDSTFDENEHLRDSNGRFTSKYVQIKLTGKELGEYENLVHLKDKALSYAVHNFKDSNGHPKKFKNHLSGNHVFLPLTAVKHTLRNASIDLAKTIPAIPQMIENCRHIESVAVREYDKDSIKVEHYKCTVYVGRKRLNIIMVVKMNKSGYRYYDHGVMYAE